MGVDFQTSSHSHKKKYHEKIGGKSHPVPLPEELL